MHPRLIYLRHRHDGPFQLAFHRAMIVHLLGKIGGAQVCSIEEFIPDTPALRNTGARHLQTKLGHIA